jgi:hypothetical protein
LLITRADVSARIIKTPGQTYQKLDNNSISNLYNIKLANKTRRLIHLELKLENIKGEIKMISVIDVPKESYFQTSFFVVLNKKEIHARKTKFKVGIYENGIRIQTATATFLGPTI